MIGAFGEVLVLDWGVSRRREEPAEPDGVVLGTRVYMAPEQAAGRTDLVTERTDVHALGAILAFLLADVASSASKVLGSVSAKAMSPDPEDRYRDAAELSAEVERFLDGGVPAAHRETLPEWARRFADRHRTAIVLVLAYLVVRVLLLLFLHR
jgi:serine/threonine protein kinase